MIIESKTEKKLLHYTGKAIADFNMIQKGDRVMVCLSGGKDSFALLKLLRLLQIRSNNKFYLLSYTLDQGLPGWNDAELHQWLEQEKIPYKIEQQDTFSIVKEKIKPGKSYCPLCARLRRGIIYRYARDNGFTKVALGHHRDDLISTLMMSILYTGAIRSMPPKLITDDKKLIVIRPLCYCQEKDIEKYSDEKNFPIISKSLCESRENKKRQTMKELIYELAKENKKVPSNILNAIQNLHPTQLMDQDCWDFKNLEKQIEN